MNYVRITFDFLTYNKDIADEETLNLREGFKLFTWNELSWKSLLMSCSTEEKGSWLLPPNFKPS